MNMNIIIHSLAVYVLSLYSASKDTHYAEDRPLYRMYLEQAGVLLALAVTGVRRDQLISYVEQHERTWGHTWLQDPVYKGPIEAWAEVKHVILVENELPDK